mmetsp:Transcript_24818/g.24322  ORF Transcript_24818/g.24322 Transcript_24818/m.24322 type:complete len:261 (+) Transcript_24818:396-1178(+)
MDIRGNYYVTECLFHGKHNLFVIAMNEKNKKDSKIEIHSFKCRSITQDSYNLPHGELGLLPDKQVQRSYSFSGCLNNKGATLLMGSGKDDMKDTGLSPSLNKTEKILEYQFAYPIRRINFCINLRLLVIAFMNGLMEGYEVSVEYEHGDDSDDEDDPLMQMKENNVNRVQGTVIMTKAFEQIDDENRHHKRHRSKDREDLIKNQYKVDYESMKMVQYFSSYMKLAVHKLKINDMCIDQHSFLTYTCADDRRIKTINLAEK